MDGIGLPSHLFPQNVLEDITLRHANSRMRAHSPDKTEKNHRRNSDDAEVPERFFNEGQEDQIAESVLKCITHLIGMKSIVKDKLHLKKSAHRRKSLPSGAVERFYYSKGGGSYFSSPASISKKHRKHSYLAADDLSSVSMSSKSSLGNESDDENDCIPDVQIKYYREGEVLIREGERNGGLFFVIDGILEVSVTSKKMFDSDRSFSSRDRKGSLLQINPGGLAGYFAALTGNVSFVTVTARSDTIVGFMRKKVLDRYIEQYPNILLCLSKRLVNQLPPLVFHIDIALEWVFVINF